jgi:hypothetical protein
MSKNIQVNNAFADSLSRFQLQRFRDLAPTAEQTPSDLPVEFLSIISDLLNHSLAPSTARTYNRAIEMFSFFRKDLGLPLVWPAPLQDITAFVAYMYKLG